MTPSVFVPLLGVVVGAAGALLGQGLANRVGIRQASAARAAVIRSDRRNAITAFLEAAQAAEEAAYREDAAMRVGSDSRMHNVWFRQKCLELVCTSPVRSGAWDYAQRLGDAIYDEVPEGTDVFRYLSERREPFLAVARTELGIADVPARPAS